MSGNAVDTTKGQRVDLTRVNYPSMFGDDITTIRLETEYHTNERLRIKVR